MGVRPSRAKDTKTRERCFLIGPEVARVSANVAVRNIHPSVGFRNPIRVNPLRQVKAIKTLSHEL